MLLHRAFVGHRATALLTGTASLNAFIHFTYLHATLCTGVANFCASRANNRVHVSAGQHEVRGRPAQLGTTGHQPEMVWFNVPSASFKTMIHCRLQAGAIAMQTLIDALLHGGRLVHLHGIFLRNRMATGNAYFMPHLVSLHLLTAITMQCLLKLR